jgi:hypothetical protein
MVRKPEREFYADSMLDGATEPAATFGIDETVH